MSRNLSSYCFIAVMVIYDAKLQIGEPGLQAPSFYVKTEICNVYNPMVKKIHYTEWLN